MKFCSQFGISPLPLQEESLCRFVAGLSESVSWGTIRSYLSALRFYQIAAGLPDPTIASFPRLSYLLKRIRKSTPEHTRTKRLPITPHILRRLHGVWSQGTVSFDESMLWAACCVGFFGFMRAGEFTCNSTHTESDDVLSAADVFIDSRENPQVLMVFLRHSKTDTFSAGVHIYMGRTGDTLCPVTAVLGYLAIRPHTPGPLFVFEDGSPLTRAKLVTRLRAALTRAGVSTTGYSGHSFRIGAATTAAQAGLSDSLIQTLGRWRSSAFTAYIRTPTTSLATVAATLVEKPT